MFPSIEILRGPWPAEYIALMISDRLRSCLCVNQEISEVKIFAYIVINCKGYKFDYKSNAYSRKSSETRAY